jgi:hypothetical protein
MTSPQLPDAESPEVELWFAASEEGRTQQQWGPQGYGVYLETALGALFLVGGMIFAIAIPFELIIGFFVILGGQYNQLIPLWFGLIVVTVAAAWLWFEVSEGEGLSVSEEWAPPVDP